MAILTSSDGLVCAVVVLVFDLTKCAQEKKRLILLPVIRLPGPRNGCSSYSQATSVFSPPLCAWILVGSPNSLTDARNNCRTVSARLLLEQ